MLFRSYIKSYISQSTLTTRSQAMCRSPRQAIFRYQPRSEEYRKTRNRLLLNLSVTYTNLVVLAKHKYGSSKYRTTRVFILSNGHGQHNPCAHQASCQATCQATCQAIYRLYVLPCSHVSIQYCMYTYTSKKKDTRHHHAPSVSPSLNLHDVAPLRNPHRHPQQHRPCTRWRNLLHHRWQKLHRVSTPTSHKHTH